MHASGRHIEICVTLAAAGIVLLFALMGTPRPWHEWRWIDLLGEGGAACVAWYWMHIVLGSRPAGRVTFWLSLGLAGLALGMGADALDEVLPMRDAPRIDKWLESGLVPLGMLMLTAGLIGWRREQFQLSEHMQLRERLFREHRGFDRITQLARVDYLRDQISLEQRDQTHGPAALVMIEVLNLQALMHEHGRRDAVRGLQAVTHQILLNLRTDDLLCRYSGDRFVLLLPRTSPMQARHMALHLERMVAMMAFHGSDGQRHGLHLRTACAAAIGDAQLLLTSLNRAMERGVPEPFQAEKDLMGATMPAYFDATTPIIPVQHQPAVLLEHLQSLDLNAPWLWQRAGLGRLGPGTQAAQLSPLQWLELLRCAAQALADPELPFQLGRQLLPGHYGAASHALLTADTLRRALQVLSTHAARLSPLMVPHIAVEGRLAVLYWTDACPTAGLRPFLVDLQMSAVSGALQWLAGQHLPWSFLFNRSEPARRDAHEVHLGTRLRFQCHLDAMVIDADWLDRPWSNPRALRSTAITEALDREAEAQEPRRHFLALVYTHLEERVRRLPGLEATAEAFGMSAATFKRRLAVCGTHYQAEMDQVRLHTALRLLHGHGLDNEAIGRYLGFDDPANFRRSMKRWAGLTPAQLRFAISD